MWKLPRSFGKNVRFRKISKPENQVKLHYFKEYDNPIYAKIFRTTFYPGTLFQGDVRMLKINFDGEKLEAVNLIQW